MTEYVIGITRGRDHLYLKVTSKGRLTVTPQQRNARYHETQEQAQEAYKAILVMDNKTMRDIVKVDKAHVTPIRIRLLKCGNNGSTTTIVQKNYTFTEVEA